MKFSFLHSLSNILNSKVGKLQYIVKNTQKIGATRIPKSFIVLPNVTFWFSVLKVYDRWWSGPLHSKAKPAA